MKKSNKFSPEGLEHAVRVVQQHGGDYPSLWAATISTAPKIGRVPQPLNEWVKRVEFDTGVRDGVTTAEPQRVKGRERRDQLVPNQDGNSIRVADHCYGCTAGQGGICAGTLPA